MRILAIRLARFGDIVLLLPAIRMLKNRWPSSHITFLTDARWQPLAAMCPVIDEIIPIDRIGMRDGTYGHALKQIWRLARDLRRVKFDVAIDFHGFRETNLIAWWSRAGRRWGLKRSGEAYLSFCFNEPPVVEDKSVHVADMFLRVADRLGEAPTSSRAPSSMPALVVPHQEFSSTQAKLPNKPFVAFYADAPVPERAWPMERFVKLGEHVIKELGSAVVMLTGSNRNFAGSIPTGFYGLSNLTIPQLAAAISSARVLISNDTGPMHLGPALGIPTVGIFSVGIPAHFRPTGLHDRVVQGNPIERVEVESVWTALKEVWLTTESSNPRC